MSSILRFSVTILLLAAAGGSLALRRFQGPESLAVPLLSIGEQIAGWTEVASQPAVGDALERLRPSEHLIRTYRKGENSLGLFIAYYSAQRAGRNMHSPRNCLPGSGWEIWDFESRTVEGLEGKQNINRLSIQNQGQRMVVYYWYQSAGGVVANEYLGKLRLIEDTVLRGRSSGALVRITTYDAPGVDEQVLRFASALIPQVDRCFNGRSDTRVE